jgi:hypothetical protein
MMLWYTQNSNHLSEANSDEDPKVIYDARNTYWSGWLVGYLMIMHQLQKLCSTKLYPYCVHHVVHHYKFVWCTEEDGKKVITTNFEASSWKN